MNAYREMKDRHQAEVNAFPFGFAFGTDQFVEMMREWKLCHGHDGRPTKNDCSQVLSIGCGGYVRKTDADAMHEMFDRHTKELADAIAENKDDFVYQMFCDEMANHEYGYTCDPHETLMACGLNMIAVQNDPQLHAAWKKAENQIMKEYEECNA